MLAASRVFFFFFRHSYRPFLAGKTILILGVPIPNRFHSGSRSVRGVDLFIEQLLPAFLMNRAQLNHHLSCIRGARRSKTLWKLLETSAKLLLK
jgi:hypothetical protein